MTKATELEGLIGTEVGVSKWIEIDQKRIDAFADCTEDWQFIHIDPEAAKQTPFGGTIAHGFLTVMSLGPSLLPQIYGVEGAVMGVNYGFDKLRFINPVPSGSKVRGRFKLLSAENKGSDGGVTRWLIKHEVTVEIEGVAKPALIAEWLGMQMVTD